MREFAAKILCPKPLNSKESGECLLSLWAKHFPRHLPERYGQAEPLRRHFDVSRTDLVLDEWGHLSFTLDRSNPDALLHVIFCPPLTSNPRHTTLSLLRFQSKRDEDTARICDFLCDVSEVFDADYSIAHILTHIELEERLEEVRRRTEQGPALSVRLTTALQERIRREGHVLLSQHGLLKNLKRVDNQPGGGPELASRQEKKLRLRIEREGYARLLREMTMQGTHTVHLRKRLQDLYWVNIFGTPYVEMFGRERLLSSPVHEIRELSTGAVMIKLTESLKDVPEEWEAFKSVRNHCKNHLDRNAFLDPAAPQGKVYNVPKFRFPLEMYKVCPSDI